MKAKLKIIIITCAAASVFWCLVVVSFFWVCAKRQPRTDAISQLFRFGYHYVVIEQNYEGRNSTLVVDAIQTNSTGTGITRAELLRTNLIPSQTMMLGLRREKVQR